MDGGDSRGTTVLVTGATGFIGGLLAGRLAACGYDVFGLTRSAKTPQGWRWRSGDLLDPDSLLRACRGIDAICHCAGALGRWRLADKTIWKVNAEGPTNLLKAASAKGVKYFVHFSTAGVTGPTGRELANEGTPCRPRTAYERSKLAGERRLLMAARELRLPACVVRPTFVYGPNDPHKLPLFRAVQRRCFFFIGDGLSTIHPVHVADLLDGVMLVLEKRPLYQIYNLGGPRPVTVRELVRTMARALNVVPPSMAVPAGAAWMGAALLEGLGAVFGLEPPLTRSRVMMLSRSRARNTRKARRELGYQPRIYIHEGIKETVAWYRQHGLL